jgi:hypothetical protein
MYPEFIDLCLSIPPKMKYKEKIYLQWINQIHPDLNRFVWERTGFRPSHHWKTQLSRLTKKVKQVAYTKLGQEDRLSMTPYDYWFRNQPRFQEFYQQQFEQNSDLLTANQELHKDIKKLYEQGHVIEKSMVLTLLTAIKNYQLNC